MSDIVKVSQGIDSFCNREIKRASAEKMHWLQSVCLAFVAVAFGSVGLYAALSKRRLYPLVVTAVAFPLAYWFFFDGYRALQRSERIKREALKGVETRLKSYLDCRAPIVVQCEPKQDAMSGLKGLIRSNAGTIASGVLMVTEVATGVPINTILKSTTSFCVQQMANQPVKKEKTIDPVVEVIFEIEFKRLILQAARECYERYIDDATLLQRKTTTIESPNLTRAITTKLEHDLAGDLVEKLRYLIKEDEIEPFKEIHVPKIIRGIKDRLESLDSGWVQI